MTATAHTQTRWRIATRNVTVSRRPCPSNVHGQRPALPVRCTVWLGCSPPQLPSLLRLLRRLRERDQSINEFAQRHLLLRASLPEAVRNLSIELAFYRYCSHVPAAVVQTPKAGAVGYSVEAVAW